MSPGSEQRDALVAEVIDHVEADRRLPDDLARELEAYLDDTWPERVPDVAYGRYVSLEALAIYLIEQASLSLGDIASLRPEDLMSSASEAIDTIINTDDELDLPGATVSELRDASGRSAWLVDRWGGGYIASGPPHEFLGPFRTAAEARRRHADLGFRDGSELGDVDLPLLRRKLADLGQTADDS